MKEINKSTTKCPNPIISMCTAEIAIKDGKLVLSPEIKSDADGFIQKPSGKKDQAESSEKKQTRGKPLYEHEIDEKRFYTDKKFEYEKDLLEYLRTKNTTTKNDPPKKEMSLAEVKSKIKEIEAEIASNFYIHDQSIATQTAMVIMNGSKFCELKGYIKKTKRKWGNYFKQKFAHIVSERTAQRWMSISKWVDLDKLPLLAYFTVDELETFIGLVRAQYQKGKKELPKNLVEYFTDAKIDLSEFMNDDSIGSVAELRNAFRELTDNITRLGVFADSEWAYKKSLKNKENDPAKILKEKQDKTKERKRQRQLKKEGKKEFTVLQNLTERAISTLSTNLEFILFKGEKIVSNDGEKSFSFNPKTIEGLIERLQMLQARIEKENTATEEDFDDSTEDIDDDFEEDDFDEDDEASNQEVTEDDDTKIPIEADV